MLMAFETRFSTMASTAFSAPPVARWAASNDFGEMMVSPVLSS